MQHKALVAEVRSQFRLALGGIHGVSHWARVQYHSLKIAEQENARKDVVKLFALLHDSQRWEDGFDPDHGLRVVEYAKYLRGHLFEIDNQGFALLCEAMAYHSEGRTDAEITVQTGMRRKSIKPIKNKDSHVHGSDRSIKSIALAQHATRRRVAIQHLNIIGSLIGTGIDGVFMANTTLHLIDGLVFMID